MPVLSAPVGGESGDEEAAVEEDVSLPASESEAPSLVAAPPDEEHG
jgi:hypothetical protein